MNKQTKKAIKRKIRPLMPESAYLYFLKWFDPLPEIDENEIALRKIEECTKYYGDKNFSLFDLEDWLQQEKE